MQSVKDTKPQLSSATAIFAEDELRAIAQAIIASGALGRSKHYAALLRYLVECSIQSKTPKEIELAVDVLGKDDSFDVTADSSVRVYIHQLRKKLDHYYDEYIIEDSHRLVIPKGQYTLAAISRGKSVQKGRWLGAFSEQGTQIKALLAACIVLLLANLVVFSTNESVAISSRFASASLHPIWKSVVDDEQPILLVMGDYYIFGELNANGNIARMVRDFNVNSPNDLEDLQFSDIEKAENYLDLDLSYMPEGSAYALARIVPILEASGKAVNITMMSDLTTSDIRDNHIVYIGYISALEKLKEMTFASSGLQIGRSYDELVDRQTMQFYTSDAGLPEEGEPFRDYGMFSIFPASSETQVVMIAGMRDAGLMQTAKALSDAVILDDLLVAVEDDTDEALASFEALFEVYGVDRLNLDANIVYTKPLDAKTIWSKSAQIDVQ